MDYTVEQAIKILDQGGIVIFPTDTAFGIGCRMDNQEAVQRLFALRRRPEVKAVPVLVSGLHMARKYLQPIPEAVVAHLTRQYWPGALTVVLPCRTERVNELVRGGGQNLGVRMPDHQTMLTILRALDVPIIGTSANFPGDPTPYEFANLNPELIKLADFVLKGECTTKHESTVIDCSVTPWQILRQGAITVEIPSL